MLQHRYYLYQRTFPIHEYGVWLEISYMKRFFVTAVYRVTTQSNVILVEGDFWHYYLHYCCSVYLTISGHFVVTNDK